MTDTLDARLARAEGYLARFKHAPLGNFIGGRNVAATGHVFDNLSPVNNAVINQVGASSQADLDAACAAADDAFADWRSTSGAVRRKILHKVADLIVSREEEIAFIECMDTGQAYRFMSKAAVRASENYRFFADRAPDAANGLSLPATDHINYTVRSPIGPVGVITLEHTVHVVDMENCAGLGFGLHGCSQAG